MLRSWLATRSSAWRVLVAAGVGAAALIWTAGGLLERRRFGPDPEAAAVRVEREVRAEVDRHAASLRAVVERLRATADIGALLADHDAAGQRLFDVLARAGLDADPGDGSITLYASDRTPVAWGGRPSPLPGDRLDGPEALFVAPGPLGLRLIYLAPVVHDDAAAPRPRRVGSVVAEHILSPAPGVPPAGATTFELETSLGPVGIRPRYEGAGAAPAARSFLVAAPSGEALFEAVLDPAAMTGARGRWRAAVRAVSLGVLAVSVLFCAAPLFDAWRRARTHGAAAASLAAIAAAILLARLVAWLAASAAPASASGFTARSSVGLLLTALAAAGLVGLALLAVQRVRTVSRTRRVVAGRSLAARAAFSATQAAAGLAVGGLLVTFARRLDRIVLDLPFDAVYLALHPWNPTRFAAVAGLLLLHAAVFWFAVGTLSAALLGWRLRRHRLAEWLLPAACWVGGAALVLSWAAARAPLPAGAGVLVAVVAAAATVALGRGVGWFRRGSQALRLGAALAAIVLPSLLLYPSLAFYAERQKANLIERQYAAEAMTHPQALKRKLDEALGQIDAQPGLADRIRAIESSAVPGTDAAFLVWQHTVLAAERLTSAVEVYDPAGRLVSRFALNFPEYAARAPRYEAVTCAWEIFGEAASFGAEERRMLHAEKAVCEDGGRRAGSLVVHVMPDYDVLSFISVRNPYFELLRGAPGSEARPGGEVGLVIYGWGRTPIYTSTGRAWPLDDEVFRRVYASRTPFWATLPGPERDHRVFFANDRFGVYALDYPLPGTYDHFVHLAEITTLSSLGFVLLVVVASAARRLLWRGARPGRRLLGEIRASFYRKVFLAFVGAAVVPALVLALLIRSFVAARLRADVEAEAARTVTVAQRLTEETLALQRPAEPGPGVLSDDLLVWVSRVLDQAVNVFDGPQLVATSERDLFASGLLPTRVPASAYRGVVLERLPSFVGEDRMGSVRYLMAAAPVRAMGPRATLTVPLALRQREIEQEIDDLDRGVQLGALLFVLVGAGVGFWLAERIADPVQRLTRASRRIASGDLDARVFVRTADELQRLVESFNAMAIELQRQRAQLERTNRLEAWAEMARQVAHDIKNPLTPIQLSTEHLRRVHHDRGEPLGEVLEGCTATILSQVRLLRQIAGEFSSFATTPAPRPVPTDVRSLLEEVLQAYATGLEGRVAVSLSTAADLPMLVVDRTLIGRAVTNVIENALHAMPTGGRLDVRAVREGEMVVVEVADTGVGMDEEALSMMFEPYFSTKAIGTGLGLTIAKRNAELHGGTVTISSRKGAGTTVRLALPVSGATALTRPPGGIPS